MIDPEKQEQAAAKLAPMLKAWKDALDTPMYLDRMDVIAMDRMVKFRAHVRAGFNEVQALELCKL